MSDVSSSFVENMNKPPGRVDYGYFKCVCCGSRYWQRNMLVRRSAKCRGVRYDQDGVRWQCKAWRCRYNDQCSKAGDACPLCGAFKPPEFSPTQPAHACSPAQPSGPVSPASAILAPACMPPDHNCTVQPARCPHTQSNHFSVPVQEMTASSQCIVPRGTITHLPLLEGMTQRFLTEV